MYLSSDFNIHLIWNYDMFLIVVVFSIIMLHVSHRNKMCYSVLQWSLERNSMVSGNEFLDMLYEQKLVGMINIVILGCC